MLFNEAPGHIQLSTRRNTTELIAKAQSKPKHRREMLLFSNAQRSIIIPRSFASINQVLDGFHQHHYTYNLAFYESIGDYEASGCWWKLTLMFRI